MITRIQAAQTGVSTLTSPASLAFASPVSVGAEIFICIGCTDNGPAVSSVEDDLFNAYEFVEKQTGETSACLSEIWHGKIVNAGTPTITVRFDAPKSGINLTIVHYTVSAGNALVYNQHNKAVNLSTTGPHSHGSITTTHAVELIFTAARGTQLLPAASLPAGFTAIRDDRTQLVLEQITVGVVTTDAAFTTTPTMSTSCVITSWYEDVAPTPDARDTQFGRDVAEFYVDPAIFLTQMGRYVAYAFTCNPFSPPLPAGCPAAGLTLAPVTGRRGCDDDVETEAL